MVDVEQQLSLSLPLLQKKPDSSQRTCLSKASCAFLYVGLLIASGLCLERLGALDWLHERLIDSQYKLPGSLPVAPQEEKTGGPIWFQAHSVNDLREWESLYLKGARSFKLDPHLIRGDGSLLNRTRIIFTHNTPLFTRTRFDNFDSLLRELSPLGAIGSRLRQDNEQIRVQLCFKSTPVIVCNKTRPHRSSLEQAWLNIVDDFYDRVDSSPFINDHVEFLLDGGAKPSGCLRNRWHKWKSVWIIGDPLSPSSALTTGEADNSADNSRFVLLNNPADIETWQNVASVNFGRFNTLPYPYQVWEPDDQLEIHRHAEIFLKTKPEHSSGLHFVSNSDPLMIALYAGATGTFNRPLILDSQASCPLGIFATKSSLVAMYYIGQQLRISRFVDELGLPAVHVSTETVPEADLHHWTRFEADKSGFAVLSNEHGWFQRALVRPFDGKLIFLGEGTFAPPAPDHDQDRLGPCLMIKHLTESRKLVAIWSLKHSSNHSFDLADDCTMFGVIFQMEGLTNKTDIEHTMCLSRTGNRAVPVSADIAELDYGKFAVVFSDGLKQVYGSIWELRRNETHDSIPRWLGVGSTPRFAMSEVDNVLSLFLSDSHCSNNQELNKRGGPTALCDNAPSSSKGVMTYTMGTKRNWLEALELGKRFSACDSSLLHGAYDIGTCSVGYLVKDSERKGRGEMVMVHRTVEDQRDRSCGTPKWSNALVLNRAPFFFKDKGYLSSDDDDDEQDAEFATDGRIRLLAK